MLGEWGIGFLKDNNMNCPNCNSKCILKNHSATVKFMSRNLFIKGLKIWHCNKCGSKKDFFDKVQSEELDKKIKEQLGEK